MMPETNQLPLSEKNGGANRARNTPTCSWLTPSSTGDTLDSTVRKLPHDQLKKWNPWLLHLFLNRICFWPTGLVRLEATCDITLYLRGPSCDQGRDHMKMMQWFLILRHCSLTSSGAACWRNPLSPGTTLLSRLKSCENDTVISLCMTLYVDLFRCSFLVGDSTQRPQKSFICP